MALRSTSAPVSRSCLLRHRTGRARTLTTTADPVAGRRPRLRGPRRVGCVDDRGGPTRATGDRQAIREETARTRGWVPGASTSGWRVESIPGGPRDLGVRCRQVRRSRLRQDGPGGDPGTVAVSTGPPGAVDRSDPAGGRKPGQRRRSRRRALTRGPHPVVPPNRMAHGPGDEVHVGWHCQVGLPVSDDGTSPRRPLPGRGRPAGRRTARHANEGGASDRGDRASTRPIRPDPRRRTGCRKGTAGPGSPNPRCST